MLENSRKLINYLACPEHPEKAVSFICEDHHDMFCCQTCAVSIHRKCHRLTEIENHLSKDEMDTDFKEMNKSMKGLIAYGEAVIGILKENETGNKKEAENIHQQLRGTRAKINQLFDVLEEKTAETCRTLIKQNSLSVETKIQSVKEITDKLTVACSILDSAKQSGSGVLEDVVLQTVKDDFHAHKTSLLEIIQSFETNGLELQSQKLLNSFANLGVNQTDKMAAVKETKSKSCFPKYNGRQLLKFCDIAKTGTHEIANFSLKDESPMYGMVFLSNNHLILIDQNNGYCSLVDDTFKLVATCNLMTYKLNKKDNSRDPYCVTSLRDDIAIVSVPNKKEVYFLRLDKQFGIVGMSVTARTPMALHALSNGDIAVSWKDPVAFGISSLKDYRLEEKVYLTSDQSGRILKSFDNMAIDEKRSYVIQPCYVDKAVYCFGFKGNPVFFFL